MREYLLDPNHDPLWLANFAMVKAASQCIKAANEFLNETNFSQPEGWFVIGTSKRGWATTLLAAANSTMSGVNVVGIAPIVPIMPDLIKSVHRQWQSYGAFSFAFKDYIDAGILPYMDSSIFGEMFTTLLDPISYMDRLDKIPKLFIMSSDDEFMQFDWTNIWYHKMMGGESHLDILANSDHTMLTGMIPSISNIGTFVRSIASGI